ncbi:Dol-P-Man [Pleurostoma richardsiae]|uniref:Dol-P-Man:Man(5)GlcNAc(2)-PP-Dol alpha-1,3-mannosyltransferase n=1 Tax=Pleurostoma richardsiae TaxID=41990 RepID=A0AA38RI54_9PEZI|nr:Dol-P-Man [Pleurostoma richardsiae]
MADQQPPVFAQAARLVADILKGRHVLSKYIPPALLVLDALLCGLIIWRIPYTEIDWVAYMEQISQYKAGERDYTNIKGGTGPLVYPAGHVWIYDALYSLTDEGKNILLAQQLFAGLYLATLAMVMVCYWKAKVPPYVFPLLVLSKRQHSIFMLRCFNDCFAVFFLWLAILLFQRRSWFLGSLAYSYGVSVKMSLLLVLPAVAVILFFGSGTRAAIKQAAWMAQLQVYVAIPFLVHYPWEYLSRAFEFSRQFLFKWTVNWRFVGEEVFLSKEFAVTLLVLHASVLLAFVVTRWIKLSGKSLGELVAPLLRFQEPFSQSEQLAVSAKVTPQYVMTTMLSANVIGLLLARSLHYQFYSYLAWSTPFLLWRSGVHPGIQYILFFSQEWAWNVFPSTPVSSAVVVGNLALTVLLVWLGTVKEPEDANPGSQADSAVKQ